MIEIIHSGNMPYPKFQAEGFAAQYAFPFAQKVCKGVGYDIGCNREEWCFPGAIPIDPLITPDKTDSYLSEDGRTKGISIEKGYDALNLPKMKVDYIFSSHCLEHINDWVAVLDYWKTKLKVGGVLFLYLPHYSQHYWRSWNNRKHVNNLSPQMIKDYLTDREWNKIFVTEYDLNNSFYAIAEK